MTVIERFAPSPTGYLHIGHLHSAWTGYAAAKHAGGNWLLRIEDIDFNRARAEFVKAIYEDLHWAGLKWEEPVLFQSMRSEIYQQALEQLKAQKLLYACSCNRRDIETALSSRQEGDADHAVYPQTCRHKNLPLDGGFTLRLDMEKALNAVSLPLHYTELGFETPENISIPQAVLQQHHGDIVIARKDIGMSYHLSVVVDDATSGVTHVTRGLDLADDTAVHVLLQALLGYPTPVYRHHHLIRDENGKRLAKRDDARSIRAYREDGYSPEDIWALIRPPSAPLTLAEFLS